MNCDTSEKPVPSFYSAVAEYVSEAATAANKCAEYLKALDPKAPWPLNEAQPAQVRLTDAAALLTFNSLRACGEFPQYSASDPATSYSTCLTAVRQMLLDGDALAQGIARLQRLEVAGQVQVDDPDRSCMVLALTHCAARLRAEVGRILRIAAPAAAPAPPKSAPDPTPSQPPLATTDSTSLDLSDVPPLLTQRRRGFC